MLVGGRGRAMKLRCELLRDTEKVIKHIVNTRAYLALTSEVESNKVITEQEMSNR